MKSTVIQNKIDRFCDALPVAYQTEFVREYEKIGDSPVYGGMHAGSDAEHQGSEYIAQRLREIGVPHVELVPCKTGRYQFNDASLQVVGEERILLPFGYVSPGTDPEGLTAELVYAGKALSYQLDEMDIEGKIVLFAALGTLEGGNLAGQMEEAIRRGAAALVIYAIEDVLDEETIRVQPPNIISPVPIVGICKKDANYLMEKLKEEKPVRVCLKVDAKYDPEDGTTYNVVGEIPGMISDEKIIFTAHLDHFFRCLQDNMSSCSTVLGIAKAVIDSGYHPNRSLLFVFHGSHETGGQDTRYPYIHGSYMLANKDRTEWTGKAIVNINFEYTALRQKVLQMTASVGTNSLVHEYFAYSPDLVGGFDTKVQDAPQDMYYLLAWADTISYFHAGIPNVSNDPISEQLYDGSGPYVGRDHSNKDNWDIFDEEALEDTTRMYGSLGIFADNMPYMLLNFTEETTRIRSELNRVYLEQQGIETEAYFACIDRFEAAAGRMYAYALQKNTEYLTALQQGFTPAEGKYYFEEGAAYNHKVLAAYRIITRDLYKINAFDFICLASAQYMNNLKLINGAIENLIAGDDEAALHQCLAQLDLCLSSYYFSEEVAEHMRRQICGPEYFEKRTWAAGREMQIFTFYDVMQTYKKELEQGEGYGQTIALLREAAKREKELIVSAMEQEITVITEAGKELEEVCV